MQTDAIKIAIETLGCKVNQCDSVAIGESLMNNGYEVVSSGSKADVYIINTCIVTGKTESQSRNLIRRALRNNDRAQVIVTGCYPHKSPGDLLSISNRVHVIGNSEKKDILFFLQKILSSHTPVQAVTDISLEKSFSTPPTTRFFNRTRAFLKMQDGCNSACT